MAGRKLVVEFKTRKLQLTRSKSLQVCLSSTEKITAKKGHPTTRPIPEIKSQSSNDFGATWNVLHTVSQRHHNWCYTNRYWYLNVHHLINRAVLHIPRAWHDPIYCDWCLGLSSYRDQLWLHMWRGRKQHMILPGRNTWLSLTGSQPGTRTDRDGQRQTRT